MAKTGNKGSGTKSGKRTRRTRLKPQTAAERKSVAGSDGAVAIKKKFQKAKGELPEVLGVGSDHGKAGDKVTIDGNHFTTGCDVLFGTRKSPAVSYDQVPHHLLAEVPDDPNAPETVDVRVNTQAGKSAITPKDEFTYDGAQAPAPLLLGANPQVTGLTPNKGPTAGGTPVTISGNNLPGSALNPPNVFFGTAAATNVVWNSASSVSCNSPGQQAGQVELSVRDPLTATSQNQPFDMFTYGDPPTVTGVAPGSGSNGTPVTISGTNFTAASKVFFGGAAATQFQIQCSTIIGAVAPQNTSGAVDIRVTTTAGTSAVNQPSDVFTYP